MLIKRARLRRIPALINFCVAVVVAPAVAVALDVSVAVASYLLLLRRVFPVEAFWILELARVWG